LSREETRDELDNLLIAKVDSSKICKYFDQDLCLALLPEWYASRVNVVDLYCQKLWIQARRKRIEDSMPTSFFSAMPGSSRVILSKW